MKNKNLKIQAKIKEKMNSLGVNLDIKKPQAKKAKALDSLYDKIKIQPYAKVYNLAEFDKLDKETRDNIIKTIIKRYEDDIPIFANNKSHFSWFFVIFGMVVFLTIYIFIQLTGNV